MNLREKLREALEISGGAHTAADTHGDEAVASAASREFAQNCSGDLCSGASEGMAESDCAAIGIDARRVESRELDHADACAAKASFNSITSIWSSFNPASFSAFGWRKPGRRPFLRAGIRRRRRTKQIARAA